MHLGLIPKLATSGSAPIHRQILKNKPLISAMVEQGSPLWVHRVITMFIKCFDFVPYFWNERDGVKRSEDYKEFRFKNENEAQIAVSVLNSSVFFHYFIGFGDCFHCGREFIETFPIDLDGMEPKVAQDLVQLGDLLMTDLQKNSIRRRAESRVTGAMEYDEFWPRHSKPILDRIDQALGKHYGLSASQIDLIANYDVKYRMGRNGDGEAS